MEIGPHEQAVLRTCIVCGERVTSLEYRNMNILPKLTMEPCGCIAYGQQILALERAQRVAHALDHPAPQDTIVVTTGTNMQRIEFLSGDAASSE